MTGILVSLNGGVMKPMWNLWLGSGVGIEEGRSEESAWCMPVAVVGEVGDEGRPVAGCGEEADDEGFKCEERRRVARVRTVTRRGRSVDDCVL